MQIVQDNVNELNEDIKITKYILELSYENLTIINDFYIDDDNYDEFKDFLQKDKLSDYIAINYKKMLYINDDINSLYSVNLNGENIKQDNFVKNGSLIFEINRVIDYNTDIKERFSIIKDLEMYLKNVESEISKKLRINVKILYHDILIPPKKNK